MCDRYCGQSRRPEAPDPAAIAPGRTAPELTSLCRDLLNRDPGLRPTGPAILERLGSAGTTVATQTVVPQGTTLIRNGQPLSILHHALASAVEGHTTAVYIHGAGGVGKTALVRYFLDHILDRGGVTLLEGRCDERESVPFKAIDRLIDHLNQALKRFSPDELKALFPPDTAALCRIFPVLQPTATLAGIDSQLRDVPEPKELRMRAFGAMQINRPACCGEAAGALR